MTGESSFSSLARLLTGEVTTAQREALVSLLRTLDTILDVAPEYVPSMLATRYQAVLATLQPRPEPEGHPGGAL